MDDVIPHRFIIFSLDFTCPAASSQFVCADNSTFIAREQVCDGIIQCPGGDDEMNCSK